MWNQTKWTGFKRASLGREEVKPGLFLDLDKEGRVIGLETHDAKGFLEEAKRDEGAVLTLPDESETVSVEEAVLEKLRTLPPERQREVLNFVGFLESKISQRQAALERMLEASQGAVVSEDYVAELERMRGV